MTHITCRLTVKNRDQLWNPTLGNRVWATFTLTCCCLLQWNDTPGDWAVHNPRRLRWSDSVSTPQPVSTQHVPVCYGQAGHGSVSQSPSLLRCVRRRLKLNEFGATDVGRITKQLNITAIIQSWRLSIFVHIARTDAKVILAAPPPYNWKRPPGRPRITWLNTVQHDLRAYKLRSIAEARVSNSSLSPKSETH